MYPWHIKGFYFIQYLIFMLKDKQKSSLPKNAIGLFLEYCKDIDEWPDSWEIDEADIKIGHDVVEQFKPFIISLIEKGLSKKTVKSYRDYLWALGGELIRQINDDESERCLSAKDLILKHVDNYGGPYWRHAYDEADDARYDSVCRKFFKFLTEKPS
jgi:hypothetical protein